MGEITEVFEKINSDLCSDKENYTKTVRTALSAEVCNNMFKQGFTLDQIAKSMPWLEKSDIYGLSVMLNDTPVSATDEEIENIKWTFRRTRKPKVLGKIFNTAEEQSKRRFRVNPFCPNPDCQEEHAYFTIKLTEEEINKMNAFYDKNDEENNYNDIGILFMDEPPVVVVRDYVCPVCKTKFKQAMPVYRTDEIGYKRYGHMAMGSVPV